MASSTLRVAASIAVLRRAPGGGFVVHEDDLTGGEPRHAAFRAALRRCLPARPAPLPAVRDAVARAAGHDGAYRVVGTTVVYRPHEWL